MQLIGRATLFAFLRCLPHKMGDGVASSPNVIEEARGEYNVAARVVDDDGGLPIRFRASIKGV